MTNLTTKPGKPYYVYIRYRLEVTISYRLLIVRKLIRLKIIMLYRKLNQRYFMKIFLKFIDITLI